MRRDGGGIPVPDPGPRKGLSDRVADFLLEPIERVLLPADRLSLFGDFPKRTQPHGQNRPDSRSQSRG
jgi:hypothetical protein